MAKRIAEQESALDERATQPKRLAEPTAAALETREGSFWQRIPEALSKNRPGLLSRSEPPCGWVWRGA
jgi:hypothetical protein